MNSEYALVRILLDKPTKVLELTKKGFKPVYLKNPGYRKLYKAIVDSYTKFKSSPTDEQIKACEVDIGNEEVTHTLEHLLDQIEYDYNLRHYRKLLQEGAQSLSEGELSKVIQILTEGPKYQAKLSEQRSRNSNINNCVDEFWVRYKIKEKFKGQIIGVPTGFKLLDEVTMGLQKQWLITISGRNASYKTWVLTSWALEAWSKGRNVVIFSCEMSEGELTNRVLALGADVPVTNVTLGNMTGQDMTRMQTFVKKMQEPPFGTLILNDNPTSIQEVDLQIETMMRETPLDIVFIDSAYRMRSDGDSEVVRQGNIARQSKDLAKKYDIPVVCTVQLNREFAKANATDKSKSKTTSGGFFVYGTDAWNQDSDLVFSLNRPEDYEPFNYNDFIMDKFRHGRPENFILEINLDVPRITQVDSKVALARIVGAPSQTTIQGNSIIQNAADIVKNMKDLWSNGQEKREQNEEESEEE